MAATVTTRRRTALPYLPALDGIRGLLVFPVVAYHFSITGGVAGWELAPGSYLAPSMFFTLSGFLITSLLLAERERSGGIDWGGFWSRRFRRLLPASLAVVLGCVVLKALSQQVYGPMTWSDTLAGILSAKNWQSIVLENGDPTQAARGALGPLSPYWSLAVEEQFYLGLSIVVALAARSKHALRWLVGFLVTLWCYSALSLLLIDGSATRMFFGTDTRASEVVSGCLLAVVMQELGWPRSKWWSGVGWVGLVVTIAAWQTLGHTEPWVIHGGLLLASALNIALILGGVVEGSFARVMTLRPLVELGKISYPVYLVHWPVALVLQPERTHLGQWPLMLVRFVVSVGLGWMLGNWIEKPIRTRRVLPGRRAAMLWLGVAISAVVLAAWRGGS
ncbi:MAG: acyltransferase [Microthrixaceae bacterium]|nr:acyltransferase [Microthrixaceae bacterium]